MNKAFQDFHMFEDQSWLCSFYVVACLVLVCDMKISCPFGFCSYKYNECLKNYENKAFYYCEILYITIFFFDQSY